MPQQILDDYNYDVLIRPTTPRPTLATLYNAPQVHLTKPSYVRTTCVNASYHAKLDMIHTTGGNCSLISGTLNQADDIKLGACWEATQ